MSIKNAWNLPIPQATKQATEQATKQATFVKPLIFVKLNRKLLSLILEHLSSDDLSSLSATCRRLNNLVQFHLKELQVLVHWYDEDMTRTTNCQFKHLVLEKCSPANFFYPDPPFRHIKRLYLCFEDLQQEKINLTKFNQLEYLKIRGAGIRLSSNRLPSIIEIDIDDPNNCEKQVFCNLENFHLEANIEELSQLNNTTESEAVRYIFIKSLDVLFNKKLNEISFNVILVNMDLLVFEMFIDSLVDFLRAHQNHIKSGYVTLCFEYTEDDEEKSFKDNLRWKKAWNYLNDGIHEEFHNLDLLIKPYQYYGIPVV